MKAMGIDIGYSNLNLSMLLNSGEVVTECRPAGAGPSSERSTNLLAPGEPGIQVEVDGTEYTACISQSEFPTLVRQLSTDYSRTSQYKALFYAALAIQGDEVVDYLVTGLPVEICKNPKEREFLVNLMTGKHEISPGRVVEVKSVEVIPQPLGSFLAAIDETLADKGSFSQETILILDPGFYSFDFALISSGALVKNLCGNNHHAMSVVLEHIKGVIEKENGGHIPIQILESIIRSGDEEIYIRGEKRPISKYLEHAKKAVADLAVKDVLNRLRNSGLSANKVIVTGGGARFWADSVSSGFSDAEIVVMNDSVNANARGYLQHARTGYEQAA